MSLEDTANATMDDVKRRLTEIGSGALKDKVVVNAGLAMSKETSSIDMSMPTSYLDKNWSRRSFMISDATFDHSYDLIGRYWSGAARKFTDTRLGGALCINPKPQYTRYADTRVKGRLSGRVDVNLHNTDGNYGMGRYYSEAIDDNARTIFMRFGTPQFNSLTNFFANFYDQSRSLLARTGRLPGTFYIIGQSMALVAGLIFVPIITTALIVGDLMKTYAGRSNTKFYTSKPSMHSYWSTVSMLVNLVAINRGILARSGVSKEGAVQGGKVEADQMAFLHELAPDIFLSDSMAFDIIGICNRARRIYNAEVKKDQNEQYGSMSDPASMDSVGTLRDTVGGDVSKLTGLYAGITEYSTKPTTDNKGNEIDPAVFMNPPAGVPKKSADDWVDFLKAEYDMGSQFLALRVDSSGSVSESFSNGTKDSDLGSKANGIAHTVREARFDFANGNMSDNVLSNSLESVVGAVTDLATGAIDRVGLGGLAALAGGAFVDIPKHWADSTANLPRADYSFKLVSPYGNGYSQIQNIVIPICALLAGALPLSAGSQSYTSPFLCELYDRGRVQIQLGIIDSLSITRGTTNLAFDRSGHAMGVDVSFSVIDLSTIMHMPIPILANDITAKATFAEDSPLTDYLAVLAGQSLDTQIFDLPKARVKLAKTLLQYNTLTSKSYMSSWIYDSAQSSMLNAVFRAGRAMTGQPDIFSNGNN
jgi:hypothetical protein